MTDRRVLTLHAALGFLQLPPRAPELQLLHRWMDSWTGVGLIAVGLHRQGWDLQLTQYGDGNWRATFYVTGQAHSIVAPEELGRGETRRQHYEAVRTFQLVIRVAASSLNHLRA